MKELYRTGIALFAMLILAAQAWAGAGPAGHQDDAFSAGEPGEANKPARIVQVTMGEADSKMTFAPDKIEVRKDEQIKFVLRNDSEIDHEFIHAAAADNLKHAEAMRKNPDMEHDNPNNRRLAPKKSGEIVWKFTKRGTFEYSCLIPGHREAGMIGTVVVK